RSYDRTACFLLLLSRLLCFFFTCSSPSAISPLSLHDALPIFHSTVGDRLVRVQLQQLHHHLHAHQRRPGLPGRLGAAGRHGHPDLGDLPDLRGLRRTGRLRPGQRPVDHRVHRHRNHLGAGLPPDPQARGDLAMTTLPSPTRARTASRRRRWLSEVGWKYPVALVVVFYAAFPLVYALSAALDERGSLSGSEVLFRNVSLSNFSALG